MKRLSVLLVGAALAVALKLYYAHAGADDLRWILAPTAWLVEAVSRARFVYEPGSGYLSREQMFLIEKPCAGVNFLVAAIVVSTVIVAAQKRSLARLGVAVAASYVTAVVANAARITIAIFVARGERVHRIEGVAVYFIALICLSTLLDRERTLGRYGYAVALLPYYAVALLVPLAHGGVPLEHIVVAATLPLAVVAVAACVTRAAACPRISTGASRTRPGTRATAR